MPRDLRTPRYARLRSLILDARKDMGLSQAAVAEKLGRPQSYVADIERNERRIDVIEFLGARGGHWLRPGGGAEASSGRTAVRLGS